MDNILRRTRIVHSDSVREKTRWFVESIETMIQELQMKKAHVLELSPQVEVLLSGSLLPLIL